MKPRKCSKRCAIWSFETLVTALAVTLMLIVFAALASLTRDLVMADAVPQTVTTEQTFEERMAETSATLDRLNAKLDYLLAE